MFALQKCSFFERLERDLMIEGAGSGLGAASSHVSCSATQCAQSRGKGANVALHA